MTQFHFCCANGLCEKHGWLGRGNRVIDEAAEGSGRDPRSIRRLLNIGVVEGQSLQWVEQLRPMALEHGVSTFISMGDDP